MREVVAELKSLRLHGMAQRYEELLAEAGSGIQSAGWLIEGLLEAEVTDRHVRSIRYQMGAARFPVHRDLAGFDFAKSRVDEKLIRQLASAEFTDSAANVVFIGGTGTGKTHLATALGVKAITQHGKRVRFFSTVDLANSLELERRLANRDDWPTAWCMSIWSCSTNWATCRSAKPAVPCCFTCCPSSTNAPA